jgi:hypothetical protein
MQVVAEGKEAIGGATEGDKDEKASKWAQKLIAQLKNYFRPLKNFKLLVKHREIQYKFVIFYSS